MGFLSRMRERRRRAALRAVLADPTTVYRVDEDGERIAAAAALFDIPPDLLRPHPHGKDCRCFPTKEDK